ncbi:MAG TPA: AIR carboxylase family protein [Frankiaceae bacterium]
MTSPDRVPQVAVIYGSPTEHDVMARVGAMLARFQVTWEEEIISPHRSPRALADYAADLEHRGVKVAIAGGGVNASLASILAAYTTVPVIGVPLRGGGLNGLDALLAMTSMSQGVPVACVGLDHSTNAAILAVQILAVADPVLRMQLARLKEDFEAAASYR